MLDRYSCSWRCWDLQGHGARDAATQPNCSGFLVWHQPLEASMISGVGWFHQGGTRWSEERSVAVLPWCDTKLVNLTKWQPSCKHFETYMWAHPLQCNCVWCFLVLQDVYQQEWFPFCKQHDHSEYIFWYYSTIFQERVRFGCETNSACRLIWRCRTWKDCWATVHAPDWAANSPVPWWCWELRNNFYGWNSLGS